MSDTANPLRVLEIETFGQGGLIHYAWNLSGALAGRGHDVHLLTATEFELEGRPVPDGVTVHRTVGALGSRLGGLPGAVATLGRKGEVLLDARKVAAVARSLRPDIIHLHSTNASAIAFLSGLRTLGTPLVSTAHVVTPHERIALQDSVYRRIHHLPDAVIAHSTVDRDRLAEEFDVSPSRVSVIPHGDYAFFNDGERPPSRAAARDQLGLDAGAPVALFFGYLREYKGLDLLLDAWPAVLGRVPDARLVVAGNPVRLPPDRLRALRAQAAGLGVLHRFEYIPFDEVPAYFAAADVLALPYRAISQSGVLYLALSLGVPVVASRVGAWPDMLDDGQSALLVPPGSVPDLADALARTLGDPALRGRLVEGGRRVAEAHSWPAIAAQTEELFRSLLGSGGQAGHT
ncbi:MAG: glycosyltransferase family 4 protein [Xanthomonadales bacterium]|jgi:glycosyltransferase involved in cell wall biosynthesis|nr:glycosyltransferase family 4 protein [Xanthomonadales bacterium]